METCLLGYRGKQKEFFNCREFLLILFPDVGNRLSPKNSFLPGLCSYKHSHLEWFPYPLVRERVLVTANLIIIFGDTSFSIGIPEDKIQFKRDVRIGNFPLPLKMVCRCKALQLLGRQNRSI